MRSLYVWPLICILVTEFEYSLELPKRKHMCEVIKCVCHSSRPNIKCLVFVKTCLRYSCYLLLAFLAYPTSLLDVAILCNVNIEKLLSAHISHARETSLF